MPILSAEVISNWYYFLYSDNVTPLIFESWNEKEIQKTEQIKLVQGNIGTYVMSIGGLKWQTEIKSRVLISNSPSKSVLDIIIDSLGNINKFQYGNSILKSATININEEGVSCNATLWSDSVGVLPLWFNNGEAPITYARTAAFYDTQLRMGTTDAFISSGEIKIEVDVSENYFMGQTLNNSPVPSFSVQGYSISGNLEIMMPPTTDFYFTPQTANSLTTHSSMLEFKVAGRYLFDSSLVNMPVVFADINKSVESKKITTARIAFESYAPTSL